VEGTPRRIVVFGGEMNADAVDHHPYLADERDLLGRRST
jgi:hypothetical protein